MFYSVLFNFKVNPLIKYSCASFLLFQFFDIFLLDTILRTYIILSNNSDNVYTKF